MVCLLFLNFEIDCEPKPALTVNTSLWALCLRRGKACEVRARGDEKERRKDGGFETTNLSNAKRETNICRLHFSFFNLFGLLF